MRDYLARFEHALEIADIACLLIASAEGDRDEAVASVAEPLIRAAQARDVAALLAGRALLAKRLNADGVHLDLRALAAGDALRSYRDARKALAEGAIVGAICPPERHLALEVAEAGADYVGFDVAAPEAADVIAWWGEMMTVPCVAFGRIDAATAAALAGSGADFIAPEPAIASDLAGLQAAIRSG